MKRWVTWTVCLAIIAGSGVSGYVLAKNSPSIFSEETEEAASADDDTAGLNCELILIDEYSQCGHQEQASGETRDIIGKTEEEIAALYPEYVVDSFSAEQVVLRRTFDIYCGQHYILKLTDERLEILKGKDGAYETLQQLELSRYTLSAEERTLLTHGKVFSSIEDIDTYLES